MWILLFVVAPASSAARIEAAVDWAAVSDQTIERCALAGLEGLLLQTLLEEGFAVVGEPQAAAMTFRLTEEAQHISITARLGESTLHQQLALSESCDSTVGLELARAIRILARSLRDARPPVPVPTPVVRDIEPTSPPAATWTLQVAAGLVTASVTSVLGGLRLSGRRTLGDLFEAGLSLEGTLAGSRGLLVSEPAASAQLLWAVKAWQRLALKVGIEGGVVAHFFWRDNGSSGSHAAGRVGVPCELVMHEVGAGVLLMPFVRTTPVEHRSNGREMFSARRFGVAAYLFLTIP